MPILISYGEFCHLYILSNLFIIICSLIINFDINLTAFPAWKPDGQRPMCAKFANFYEGKCWDPVMESFKRNMSEKALKGKHRLQCKYSFVKGDFLV